MRFLQVCSSRGREPDGWHGTGVSRKFPIYHEVFSSTQAHTYQSRTPAHSRHAHRNTVLSGIFISANYGLTNASQPYKGEKGEQLTRNCHFARKQLSLEEFTMVMNSLKTEDAHDQMREARQIFQR